MRDILFRGKRIDDGKWVEGWFCMCPIMRWPLKAAITPAKEAEGGRWMQEEVDPDTVGQYTGLQDKNGKRIFEGDICRVCRDPEICTAAVEYKEDIASFIWRCNENDMLLPIDFCVAKNKVGDAVWVEVVGNIHDGLELMKGEEHA